MCVFLGATITNASVDAALGCATSEIGPRWRQHRPLPISRWQTLLTKSAMESVLTALLSGLMVTVSVGLLGMNA